MRFSKLGDSMTLVYAKQTKEQMKQENSVELMVLDYETAKKHKLPYLLDLIFENGMLDDCFAQLELLEFKKFLIEDKYKTEIDYYIVSKQQVLEELWEQGFSSGTTLEGFILNPTLSDEEVIKIYEVLKGDSK
jgi:hypothetical protein